MYFPCVSWFGCLALLFCCVILCFLTYAEVFDFQAAIRLGKFDVMNFIWLLYKVLIGLQLSLHLLVSLPCSLPCLFQEFIVSTAGIPSCFFDRISQFASLCS